MRVPNSPILLAFLAVLVVLAISVAGEMRMPEGRIIDNDSQMRLVQVRDLLAGQGWFDVHQYRLGMPEGSSMHWSRLVDAPIAVLIALGSLVAGSQLGGETIALVLWPAITLFFALASIIMIARKLGGSDAMVPAAIVGALTLQSLGIFGSGAIDHHNIELALTLATLAFLLASIDRPLMAFFAGASATLALAIGMETAAYIAFAGTAVAAFYLIKGKEAATQTANFGMGFAATAVAALVVTRSPSAWLSVECDAYSAPQFSVAVVAGLGIAAIARSGRLSATPAQRFAALALLGAGLAGVLLVAFPQCLAAPYSEIDPRLRAYMMGGIVEAQPIWNVIRVAPITAAQFYPPVVVALCWLVWCVWHRGIRIQDAFLAGFLVPAALVTIYQLRGGSFALGFAIAPLAMMIAEQRRRYANAPSARNNLRVVFAWLVSVNTGWAMATMGLTELYSPGAATKQKSALVGNNACRVGPDFAKLAALPPATVVSIMNLGPGILRYTHHHSLAGPYHRNVEGNLLAIDLLAARPDQAREIAIGNNVDLMAICPGNPESGVHGADSLQSELMAGRVPAWLTLVPETAGANLQIYRVSRD